MLGLSCILDVVADEIVSLRQGIREIGNVSLPDHMSHNEACEWIATHAVERLTTTHGIPTVDWSDSSCFAVKTHLAPGVLFECIFDFDREERSLQFHYAIITKHVDLTWKISGYAANFDKFFDGEDVDVDSYPVDDSDFSSSFHDLKELHAAFARANVGTFSLTWARAALDSWSDDLDDPEAVTYCMEE